MKKTFRILSMGAIMALLALSVFAGTAPQPQPPAVQGECTPENKAAWYKDFIANYKGDQVKAYDLAKKFIACPGDSADADDAARAAYLQKFVTAYEKAHLKDALNNALTKKDYPAAFQAAKTVFAQEPNYLNVYLDLAIAGTLSNNA